jgi:hypothetical protein
MGGYQMKNEELIKQGLETVKTNYEEAMKKFIKTGNECDFNKYIFNGIQLCTLQWVLDLEVTPPRNQSDR